jgi:pilus assembly protein Flp/PilA
MLKALIERFRNDESGQGLVEYVLIIALVAIGLVLVITLFRNSIGGTFDNVTQTLNNAPSSPYSPS